MSWEHHWAVGQPHMSYYMSNWHSWRRGKGRKTFKKNAELVAEKIRDLMKTINPQIKDNQWDKKHEENHTNVHCEHIASNQCKGKTGEKRLNA